MAINDEFDVWNRDFWTGSNIQVNILKGSFLTGGNISNGGLEFNVSGDKYVLPDFWGLAKYILATG
jgi:hypothetical protein